MKSRLFFSILIPVCILSIVSLFYLCTAKDTKEPLVELPNEIICEPDDSGGHIRGGGTCNSMFTILIEEKETDTLCSWVEKITDWQQ